MSETQNCGVCRGIVTHWSAGKVKQKWGMWRALNVVMACTTLGRSGEPLVMFENESEINQTWSLQKQVITSREIGSRGTKPGKRHKTEWWWLPPLFPPPLPTYTGPSKQLTGNRWEATVPSVQMAPKVLSLGERENSNATPTSKTTDDILQRSLISDMLNLRCQVFSRQIEAQLRAPRNAWS